MKIAFLSSEVYPFAKSGGLADVAGALPPQLKTLGADIKIFMPLYSLINKEDYEIELSETELEILIDKKKIKVKVYQTNLDGVDVYFFHAPVYYDRKELYTNDKDEDERFILLNKAVLEFCKKTNWIPEIFHCNDWQTSLIPYYLKENKEYKNTFTKSKTIFTIHNIAYQGLFKSETINKAGLNPLHYYPTGPIEFYKSISFLKIALISSDIITTVSETYAKEILTLEYGAGLEGVLKEREEDLYGIVNGVDYNIWSPEKDTFIKKNFSLKTIADKEINKQHLLKTMKLPYQKGKPVIGIVSRMVSQKGFDLIEKVQKELFALDAQWTILGSGMDEYQDLFLELMKKYPKKVSVKIGYSNELAHLIEAGADMFLMPSQYEPCGLNQIYSLKYGTIPIVRKTGGLADTVIDWRDSVKTIKSGTGYSFSEYTHKALLNKVEQAIEDYKDNSVWNNIITNAMNKDYSWKNSAEKYFDLYKKLLV